jgi:hypothetical protein
MLGNSLRAIALHWLATEAHSSHPNLSFKFEFIG